jgi:hypothetical protein
MNKNHIIISIGADKAFDEILYLSMIKALKKLGTEGTYFNVTKATVNIILHGENQNHFLS